MWPMPYDNTCVTVELRELVEAGVDIWGFDYPVPASEVTYNGKTAKVPFDKEALQQKIIDHYFFRQIGAETTGRWLHQFRTRMREIMPLYIQLYEFEAKWQNIDDPLESYNLMEELKRDGTNNSVLSFMDTPQGKLTHLDDGYVSNMTTNQGKTGESYTLNRRGNIGVQPLGAEVQNIRSAFLNIDAMVVAEFADLFLKTY